MGMIRNYFILNGKSSTDFNCYIAKSRAFDGAEPDVESIEIPGRNGELTYSNNRFKPFTDEIEAYIPRNMQETIDGLRAWLSNNKSFVRYEEVLHPDEFRLARFSGAFEVSESDHKGAALTLPFTFQPQRFLKSGDNVNVLTSNGSLFNPTYYDAKPLIRAYGTGSFTVNDITVTITSADEYTDIDCEIMDAYKGATNCNGNIQTTDNKFPAFRSGQNDISMTGITRLEITPRWWTV
jgi:phage-related protein